MSCGTALEARRNSDERWTFTPSSRNYTFSGMAPLFTVRRGETVLLQIDQTQTVNGSLFSVVGDSVVLQLKKGDAALLDSPASDTDAEALFYDVTLTDQTGFENWIIGGPFTLLGLNDVSCGGCNESVEVTIGGQCIQINIEGGNLGIGASVDLAELQQAVQDAEAAADEAAQSAATASTAGAVAGAAAGSSSGAAAGSASGATAGASAGAAAANAALDTKADIDSANITGGDVQEWRDKLEIFTSNSEDFNRNYTLIRAPYRGNDHWNDNILAIQNLSVGDFSGGAGTTLVAGNAALNFLDRAGTEKGAMGYSRNSALWPLNGYVPDTMYIEIGNPFATEQPSDFALIVTMKEGSAFWGGLHTAYQAISVSSQTGDMRFRTNNGPGAITFEGPTYVGSDNQPKDLAMHMVGSKARIRERGSSGSISFATNIANMSASLSDALIRDDNMLPSWDVSFGAQDRFSIKRAGVAESLNEVFAIQSNRAIVAGDAFAPETVIGAPLGAIYPSKFGDLYVKKTDDGTGNTTGWGRTASMVRGRATIPVGSAFVTVNPNCPIALTQDPVHITLTCQTNPNLSGVETVWVGDTSVNTFDITVSPFVNVTGVDLTVDWAVIY